MIRSVVNALKVLPVSTATKANTIQHSDIIHSMALVRSFHLTSTTSRGERRDLRTFRMRSHIKEDKTVGEFSTEIDNVDKQEDIFPNVDTPNRIFDGILYKELPIFNIKATPNNTIMTLTDFKGKVHILRSCGIEGFKTAKKGTNIAAQTTAITLSSKALALGVRTARVRVQGIGPGRMAAIKGLQMGGINIVSITDNTHVSWYPVRARKQRRV